MRCYCYNHGCRVGSLEEVVLILESADALVHVALFPEGGAQPVKLQGPTSYSVQGLGKISGV